MQIVRRVLGKGMWSLWSMAEEEREEVLQGGMRGSEGEVLQGGVGGSEGEVLQGE